MSPFCLPSLPSCWSACGSQCPSCLPSVSFGHCVRLVFLLVSLSLRSCLPYCGSLCPPCLPLFPCVSLLVSLVASLRVGHCVRLVFLLVLFCLLSTFLLVIASAIMSPTQPSPRPTNGINITLIPRCNARPIFSAAVQHRQHPPQCLHCSASARQWAYLTYSDICDFQQFIHIDWTEQSQQWDVFHHNSIQNHTLAHKSNLTLPSCTAMTDHYPPSPHPCGFMFPKMDLGMLCCCPACWGSTVV